MEERQIPYQQQNRERERGERERGEGKERERGEGEREGRGEGERGGGATHVLSKVTASCKMDEASSIVS